MRATIIVLLAFMLLTTGAFAQGSVAPPHINTFGIDPVINAPNTNLPAAFNVAQVHMVPYPGTPGSFLMTCTLTSLVTTHGGAGGYDLISGVYNAVTKTVTVDKNAAALNGSKTEFGLTMYHDGLLAVYESASNVTLSGYTNEIWVATRTSVTAPWTPHIVKKIQNMPVQGYWDPALANVNGQLHLIYLLKRPAPSTQGDIAMAPLNLKTLTIDRTKETIIVKTQTTSGDANSPTPIVDSKGELLGLSHHDQFNSNDHYMSFDLDPNTPSVMFITDSLWINNGGYAAGTFFDAGSSKARSVDSVWWTGGRAALGGKMEISAYVPVQAASTVPYQTLIFLSTSFLKTPMTFPGVKGSLGINPAMMVPLGTIPHVQVTGKATLSLTIPNDPVLKGLVFPGQSVTLNNKTATVYFGNTGSLTFL